MSDTHPYESEDPQWFSRAKVSKGKEAASVVEGANLEKAFVRRMLW